MTTLLKILAISTGITFLFVFIAGEKLSWPMGITIFYGLILNGTLLNKLSGLLLLSAVLYLIIPYKKKKMRGYLFTVLAILILYMPICFTIRDSLMHINRLFIVTNCVFGLLSLTTLVLTTVKCMTFMGNRDRNKI
jgi:hypothetical protein